MVFSNELAREGLGPYLRAMIRAVNSDSTCHCGGKSTAEEYLKRPKLVLNAAKFYELVYQSYRYTGLIPKVEFHDFYLAAESNCRNPVAILGNSGRFLTAEDFDIDNSTFREHGRSAPFEGDFLAGDIPGVGGARAENIGLAVFDGDRMVGELDGTDTIIHLLCTGDSTHTGRADPCPKGIMLVA